MGIFSKMFGRGAASAQRLMPAQAIAAISNRPMMLAPAAHDCMLASIQQIPERGASLVDDEWKEYLTGGKGEHLIDIESGVGRLTIRGPLFQRFGIESWWYGGMGYDAIGEAFEMLLANPKVQSIVLDIDSPGGMVSGCFELAQRIYDARGAKPITAIANDTACSAAYLIASAADRVEVSQTSTTGSVGVKSVHVDVSRWNDRMGITYTSVHNGAKKDDFSPNAPLSDGARAELQAEVDRLGELFIATVARNRGISAEAVAALQAGVLYGPAAVSAGLADGEEEEEGEPAKAGLAPAITQAAAAATDSYEQMEAAIAAERDRLAQSSIDTLATLAQREQDVERQGKVDRATVVDTLQAAGLTPDLLAALIDPKAGVTPDTVSARLQHARAVADLCVAAGPGMRSLAPDYAKANTPIETVRTQLLSAKAEDGPEISTHIPAKAAAAGVPSAQTVYDQRRQQQPT